MSDYQILPELMLCTSAIPLRTFQTSNLQEIINRPDFRTALYLANSVVYHELKKLNFDLTSLSPKLALTIYNYANRMAYRTTPFGAFSSFSFINASGSNPGVILKENDFQLHISPDLDEFLIPYNDLVHSTTTELQANCSIYYTSADGRYIFAETSAKGPFTYSTRNFSRNPAIESLLKFANKPRKIEILIRKLSSFSMTDCEADQLIGDLRAAQLLLPLHMPSITGKDTYQDFLAICRQYDTSPFPDPEIHLPVEKVLEDRLFMNCLIKVSKV